MDVMLHIPAQAWEVSLLDLAGNSLAGPIPIDATLFAAGGQLHQAKVRKFLTTTRHDDQRFVTLGRAMQAALIPPTIDHALRHHNPARIYLAIENADLQELPWELLQSTTSQFAKFLNVDKVCLRAAGKLLEPAPAAPAYPLRMLIVCGFDPSEPDAAEGYAEIAAIQQALNGSGHLLNCEVLHVAKQFRLTNGSRQVIDLSRRPMDRPAPAQSAVYDLLALTAHIASARPHILHFIGHSQDGALRLFMRGKTGADDANVLWDTARIRAFAASLADLRFVYLNSCRSGQTSEQAAALFPDSVAHTFLTQASAVVAMQSDVSGDSAKVCAEIFYQRLLEGDDAATSLNHARAQLFQ